MDVLVIVDYQKDFVDGALGFEKAHTLEKSILDICEKTLETGNKICFTKDTHFANYLNTREGEYLPVPHCKKGSEGWGLYGGLAKYESIASDNISIVEKPTFGSTQLAPAIRTLCGGEPAKVHICGVVTDICVVSNAILLHSEFLNTEIIIHSNLVASSSQDGHNNALNLLKNMGYTIV